MFAERDGIGPIEAFDMPDDLGNDPPQPIANGNHPGSVVLGRLDVEQVVDPAIGHGAFEDVKRREFTCLLDP